MMNQQPSAPQPSPYEQLKVSAQLFGLLPLNASKEEMEVSFDQIRSLLLEVIQGALDSYPYQQSWNTLTRLGDSKLDALMDMEQGSSSYQDTLAHLKQVVASALDYLPDRN